MIPWDDPLLLLEGEQSSYQPLKIFILKTNITTENIFFVTSKSIINYQGSYNSSDDRETETMTVRWKNYGIYLQVFAHEQKVLPPCPKYFVNLVFTEMSILYVPFP